MVGAFKLPLTRDGVIKIGVLSSVLWRQRAYWKFGEATYAGLHRMQASGSPLTCLLISDRFGRQPANRCQ